LAETAPPLSFINPMRALFQIPARDAPTFENPSKWYANQSINKQNKTKQNKRLT
jgi:hypothetical protein